jgi:hypothetical protein
VIDGTYEAGQSTQAKIYTRFVLARSAGRCAALAAPPTIPTGAPRSRRSRHRAVGYTRAHDVDRRRTRSAVRGPTGARPLDQVLATSARTRQRPQRPGGASGRTATAVVRPGGRYPRDQPCELADRLAVAAAAQ